MGYAIVAHDAVAGDTTPGVDITGADIVWGFVSWSGGLASLTGGGGSDSFTPLTLQTGGGRTAQLFYFEHPTISNNYQITQTGGGFATVILLAASGSSASPFDQESGSPTNPPGSITPAENNEIFICGLSNSDAGGQVIDSGFTISDQIPNSSTVGGALAYLIQTTATAENPTWNPANNARTVMATFKAATAGATSWGPLLSDQLNRIVQGN